MYSSEKLSSFARCNNTIIALVSILIPETRFFIFFGLNYAILSAMKSSQLDICKGRFLNEKKKKEIN